MRLAHRGSSFLLGLTAGCPHLTHITERLPVASAHRALHLAPADPPGAAPPPRSEQLALQAVPAGQVVPAATGVPLAWRARQAAVASVRDVPVGTAGARTGGHVAAGAARLGAHGSGEVVRKEDRGSE